MRTTTTLLTIFLALKLTGLIGWSWWWVLAPLWIPLALFVALLIVGAVCASAADAPPPRVTVTRVPPKRKAR